MIERRRLLVKAIGKGTLCHITHSSKTTCRGISRAVHVLKGRRQWKFLKDKLHLSLTLSLFLTKTPMGTLDQRFQAMNSFGSLGLKYEDL